MRNTTQSGRETHTRQRRLILPAPSVAAAKLLFLIDEALTTEQLQAAAAEIYRALGDGLISDEDAQFLHTRIEKRRPKRSVRPAPNISALGESIPRALGRFKSRQHPRSPNRQASRERRRKLGGSSALPDTLRPYYTEGQRAVLAIISFECKRRGKCDFPVDKIAALAGVCRTSVQTTLHEARRLNHINITERPRPGRKNLTNLVTIISPEWRAWIKNAPDTKGGPGSNFVKILSPTKNTYNNKRPVGPQSHTRPKSGYSISASSEREAHSDARRQKSIDNAIANAAAGTASKASRPCEDGEALFRFDIPIEHGGKS